LIRLGNPSFFVLETLTDLSAALGYLTEAFRFRLAKHFNLETPFPDLGTLPAPDWSAAEGPLGDLARRFRPTADEWLLLLTALVPHVQADFFDHLLTEILPQGGEFPALGGVRGRQHRGVLPTGETALFLLAGNDWGFRTEKRMLFDENQTWFRRGIFRLEEAPDGEPALSGRLLLTTEWVEKLTTGRENFPKFSTQFPAATLAQVRELGAWVRHADVLMADWGLSRRWRNGATKPCFSAHRGRGKPSPPRCWAA